MKSSYFKRNGHERYKNVHKTMNSPATMRRKVALSNIMAAIEAIPADQLDAKPVQRLQKEAATLRDRIKAAGHNI